MPISEVFNMDCMEYMKNIPDKFFDLLITDPPYGINAPKLQLLNGYKGRIGINEAIRRGRLNNGAGKLKNIALQNINCDWDSIPLPDNCFDELFRVSKNQIIFGGNYFNLPPSRGVGCWDKMQSFPNFSQWEMIWTSFDCPAFMVRCENGIRTKDEFEKKIHPTQKPIYIFRYLLNKFAKEGYKIFDGFMGSQTSRIASKIFGLDFWGCELDKTFFDAGCKRFDNHKKIVEIPFKEKTHETSHLF